MSTKILHDETNKIKSNVTKKDKNNDYIKCWYSLNTPAINYKENIEVNNEINNNVNDEEWVDINNLE